MNNWDDVEKLFEFQDYNKKMKLEATSDEQLKQIKENEEEIDKQLKSLYVK